MEALGESFFFFYLAPRSVRRLTLCCPFLYPVRFWKTILFCQMTRGFLVSDGVYRQHRSHPLDQEIPYNKDPSLRQPKALGRFLCWPGWRLDKQSPWSIPGERPMCLWVTPLSGWLRTVFLKDPLHDGAACLGCCLSRLSLSWLFFSSEVARANANPLFTPTLKARINRVPWLINRRAVTPRNPCS